MTIQRVTLAELFLMLSLGLGCGGPAPEAASEAPAPALPVKVLQFYASPGAVHAGEDVQICYGVEGADRVEMKPHVRDLKPGSNRCFSFAPKRSTKYTLTARGAGGEDSADLAVRVIAAAKNPEKLPSLLTLLSSSDKQVAPGTSVTLCYGVEEATAVVVEPPVHQLEPMSSCFSVVMEKTTTFRLTVTGAGGRKETRELTVSVN